MNSVTNPTMIASKWPATATKSTATLPKISLSLSFAQNYRQLTIWALSVVLSVEVFCWLVFPHLKRAHLSKAGTLWNYIQNSLLGVALPEIVTIVILVFLIERYHSFFRLRSLPFTFKAIARYELTLLPVLLIAFFVFFPITLHIRYLLREVGHYSWERYQFYMEESLRINMYFFYLPFVVVIVYVFINGSLLRDIVAFGKLPAPHKQPDAFAPPTLPLAATETPEFIEVKGNTGSTMLRLEECIYFESLGRIVEVGHPSGVFRTYKSLSALEPMLDSKLFFKGNRSFILNFKYIKSYSNYEKGKYIIELETPDAKYFVMPRTHLGTLKAGLLIKYV
ncbi:MAG: LytR/AlgR family response regulator transcription factor [Runella sp.]